MPKERKQCQSRHRALVARSPGSIRILILHQPSQPPQNGFFTFLFPPVHHHCVRPPFCAHAALHHGGEPLQLLGFRLWQVAERWSSPGHTENLSHRFASRDERRSESRTARQTDRYCAMTHREPPGRTSRSWLFHSSRRAASPAPPCCSSMPYTPCRTTAKRFHPCRIFPERSH